jgi:hypothetical protein
MGLSRYLLSGIATLGLYQPLLFGISASGLDMEERFIHRLPWITPEEWQTAVETPRENFQIRAARIVDPKISALEVLNSLPLLQKMSAASEAKFKKATLGSRSVTPANTLTEGYALGTSADTKLNVFVALGRACLNLPLFQHTGATKVKDHFFRHHSVHKFTPVALKTYALARYQDFLTHQKTSEIGFENGEFCSAVLVALVNAQEYQLNVNTQEVRPKWGEYHWKQKTVLIRPFTPRYEESFYALLQTIYTSLGHQISNLPIKLDQAHLYVEIREKMQEQQRKAQEIRALKNTPSAGIAKPMAEKIQESAPPTSSEKSDEEVQITHL